MKYDTDRCRHHSDLESAKPLVRVTLTDEHFCPLGVTIHVGRNDTMTLEKYIYALRDRINELALEVHDLREEKDHA